MFPNQRLTLAFLVALLATRATAGSNANVSLAHLEQAAEQHDRNTAASAAYADEMLTQLEVLRGRGHATLFEVTDARMNLHVAQAKRRAAEQWLALVRSVDLNAGLESIAAVEATATLFLPRSSESVTGETAHATLSAIRRLLSDNQKRTRLANNATTAEVLAATRAQLAPKDARWKQGATLATAFAAIQSEVDLALVEAHLKRAATRLEALSKTSPSALRPNEIETAKGQVADLRELKQSAVAQSNTAFRGLQMLNDLNSPEAVNGWETELATSVVPASEPLFNQQNPTAIETLLADVSPTNATFIHRRPNRSAALFPSGSRRDSNNSSPAEPAFKARSEDGKRRSYNFGAMYSSGYAFGQLRRDFPADIRLPRAESLGGPWYLPGSPTNEIRLRRRTWLAD